METPHADSFFSQPMQPVIKGKIISMLNTFGLVLDVLGAWLLLWGELYSDATILRYQGTGEGTLWFDNALAKLPWYKRWPLKFGKALGSRDLMAMSQESKLNSFPTKFWAILLLTVGFLLQALGQFTCQGY
jgi:hypothetical protein